MPPKSQTSQFGGRSKMNCKDLAHKNEIWYINFETIRKSGTYRNSASYHDLIFIANHSLKKWGLADGYVYTVLPMVGGTPDGLINFMISYTQTNHPGENGWVGVLNCQTGQVYGDILTDD
jgi:hypothetical protein